MVDVSEEKQKGEKEQDGFPQDRYHAEESPKAPSTTLLPALFPAKPPKEQVKVC